MTAVVFIQGPPRSGKDTVGGILRNMMDLEGVHAELFKFADPIADWSEAFFGVSCRDEEIKDQPNDGIPDGLSPREAAIAFSERAMKPVFGHDVFGRALLRQIQKSSPEVAIITDSGFLHEAKPVWESVGLDVCTAVQVFRKGRTFKNDSRSYWDLPEPGVTFRLDNDEEHTALRYDVQELLLELQL